MSSDFIAAVIFCRDFRAQEEVLCHSGHFSCSVISNSLRLHGLQNTRLPCPSLTHGACTNSCPSSWWCHPTISGSVIPFSCLQYFPASGSFLMSQFFSSGGQSIKAEASASVLPMNIQSFRIDWFDLSLLPASPLYLPWSNGARNTSISALLTMAKPLTMWITINCGKFFKRWEYQITWPASSEICMQVRKQQLDLDMEQQASSK